MIFNLIFMTFSMPKSSETWKGGIMKNLCFTKGNWCFQGFRPSLLPRKTIKKRTWNNKAFWIGKKEDFRGFSRLLVAFGHTFARLLPAFSEAGSRRGKKRGLCPDLGRIWDARSRRVARMLPAGRSRRPDWEAFPPGKGRHVSFCNSNTARPLHAGARRI